MEVFLGIYEHAVSNKSYQSSVLKFLRHCISSKVSLQKKTTAHSDLCGPSLWEEFVELTAAQGGTKALVSEHSLFASLQCVPIADWWSLQPEMKTCMWELCLSLEAFHSAHLHTPASLTAPCMGSLSLLTWPPIISQEWKHWAESLPPSRFLPLWHTLRHLMWDISNLRKESKITCSFWYYESALK